MIEDLSSRIDLTTALLSNLEWRSRGVEQISIAKNLSARSRRSLQVAPLREYAAPFLEDQKTDAARLVLPVATLPKRPLLSFHVETEQSGAFLLKRSAIAEREVAYLSALASRASFKVKPATAELLRAICEFSSGIWSRERSASSDDRAHRRDLARYVRRYTDVKISDVYLADMIGDANELGSRLRANLEEPFDENSSADSPFLALPQLHSRYAIVGPDQLHLFIRLLREFVTRCEAAGPQLPLMALSEYGRRYEAMVQCVVRLDEPTVIHLEQDLPLQVERGGLVELPVVFADCLTNHVSIRVEDPDAQLRTPARSRAIEALQNNSLGSLIHPLPEPVDAFGDKLRREVFTSVRITREDVAVYGSEYNRDYLVNLRFGLNAPLITRVVAWTLALLTLLAGFLAWYVCPLSSQELAVFVVPTTLASGLLLVQSRTSLGARLQRSQRRLVLVTIILLWGIVTWLYVTHQVKLG